MQVSTAKKRIYISENPDIRFETDDATGDTVMFVCGQEYTRKHVPLDRRVIPKAFKKEIEEKQDFICPTDLT